MFLDGTVGMEHEINVKITNGRLQITEIVEILESFFKIPSLNLQALSYKNTQTIVSCDPN